jgi:hypothetical protein
VNRNRRTRPIDKHLLAALVFLAHDNVEFAAPALI